MTESMHSYMKVGLIHFMAYPYTREEEKTVPETIRKIAADDYFDAVEIAWIRDPAIRQQVRMMLDVSHLTVAYGASPRLLTTGLNINDTDEDGRRRALATLKEGIDEAYEMGAVGFSFLSGKYREEDKEKAYNALVRSTDELCRYAASKGNMQVVLEVFDNHVDKKSLIGPAELAQRYAEEVCRSNGNFGLLVDLSHMPLLGETPRESIAPVHHFIRHAHMGNCVVKDPSLPAYGDVHPRFGFPGGENDVEELAEFLRVLLEIGSLNKETPLIVSFEVKPFGSEDPDLVVANAKRTLNRAWVLV